MALTVAAGAASPCTVVATVDIVVCVLSPKYPEPRHCTIPLVDDTQQTRAIPIASDRTGPNCTTCGVEKSVPASPSCPLPLLPKHRVSPVVTTQDFAPPAATNVGMVMLATTRGVALRVVEPSPSSPSVFRPQQRTTPAALDAHV